MPDPEATLRQWREWSGVFGAKPKLLGTLGGGSTNHSYLIEAHSQRFVLRLSSSAGTQLGIVRAHERLILNDAAAAGIAPAIAHCSVEDGVLITEFIDGAAYAEPDARIRCDILIALTRRIHALETPVPAVDYYAHAERYRRRLLAAGVALPGALTSLASQIAEEHEAGHAQPDASRICHRDLNPGNIIERAGRLYVIDWEYAARGASAFDFAAISAEWQLPLAAVGHATGLETRVLAHAARLYEYTCALWRLVHAHDAAL
jgi:thiamine kinase-like enzyme